MRLVAPAEDDEREMHYDVGPVDQSVDGPSVQHVAAPVLGALPAMLGGVERPARHPDDAIHLRRVLERPDQRPPDVARRARDGNGQAVH